MNIVVITDCVHYKIEDVICNKNPILTKQFDALFNHFSNITLIAPLSSKKDKISVCHYNRNTYAKMTYISTNEVGGNSVLSKMKIFLNIVNWLKIFWCLRHNKLFYLRMPNNVNIISFIFYYILGKKIFITYTGTWEKYKGEPITYRLQKFFVKKIHNGPAFVYSNKDNGGAKNIYKSFSPSFSAYEYVNRKSSIEKKMRVVLTDMKKKLEFVSVGSIVEYKNQLLGIKLVQHLFISGLPVRLRIIGNGVQYLNELKEYTKKNNLNGIIHFEGFKTENELNNIYKESDFLLHTPILEGYGKTPQEGLSFGLIPILSNFPFSRFFVGSNNERGFLLDDNPVSFKYICENIWCLLDDRKKWTDMITNCYNFAGNLTLDEWVTEYVAKINKL